MNLDLRLGKGRARARQLPAVRDAGINVLFTSPAAPYSRQRLQRGHARSGREPAVGSSETRATDRGRQPDLKASRGFQVGASTSRRILDPQSVDNKNAVVVYTSSGREHANWLTTNEVRATSHAGRAG